MLPTSEALGVKTVYFRELVMMFKVVYTSFISIKTLSDQIETLKHLFSHKTITKTSLEFTYTNGVNP